MKTTTRLLPILLTVLLTSLAAAPAAAQLVPLGPEFQVSQVNPNFQSCPRVAGRGDRGFTVAWSTGTRIEARVFNGAGSPLGPTINVDEGRLTTLGLQNLEVQNRPGQGDLVFWTSNLGNDVLRHDSRAVFPSVGPLVRLRTPAYITRVSPRRTGGYVGAWASNRGIFFLTALDGAGRPVGGSVRVNRTPAQVSFLEVVHAADGSLTALWFTPTPARLLLRRFGADLRPLGPEIEVEEEGTTNAVYVASAPDGRTAVTWVEFNIVNGVAGTIYVRFFEPDGTPASAPQAVFTVPPDEGGDNFLPEAIAVDRQGRALIVWNRVAAARAIKEYRVQLWSLAGPLSEAMDLVEDVPLSTHTPFCVDAASAGRSWVVTFRAVARGHVSDALYARRFFSAD